MGEEEDSFWEGLGYKKSGRKKIQDTKFAEAIISIGKIAPETWKNINESIQNLNRFMELGGAEGVTDAFLSITDSLKETLSLSIQDALSPITNEINQFITDALAPVYDLLNEVANNVAQFVSENKTGATIGGIAGTIIGFLTGQTYLGLIGGLIGAGIEFLITALGPQEVTPEQFEQIKEYFFPTDEEKWESLKEMFEKIGLELPEFGG